MIPTARTIKSMDKIPCAAVMTSPLIPLKSSDWIKGEYSTAKEGKGHKQRKSSTRDRIDII